MVGLISMERCLKRVVEGRVGCEIQCAFGSGHETTYAVFGARYTTRWEGEPPNSRAPVRLPFGHAFHIAFVAVGANQEELSRNPVRLFAQS